MSLLDLLIPSRRAVTEHPVYQVTHRVRVRRNPRVLSYLYLAIVFVLVLLPLIGLWQAIIEARLSEARSVYGTAINTNEVIISASSDMLSWLFVVSVGLGFVLDVSSVLSSTSSINRERASGHWDLIQMTNLKRSPVIRAKHVLAQESAARVLILLINVRLVLIVF